MELLSALLVILSSYMAMAFDLPSPRIVIAGPTGSGKSSLADVLLGQSPLCTNCTFPICSDLNSCTKETTFATGPWLGSGDLFTVVDTPGFGDSDNDDSQLIDEMMKVLKDDIGSASVILLLLKGTETRLDSKLQQMIREMTALFGSKMWDNIVVGVSFWSYSPEEISRRNKTCQWSPENCHDEMWFKEAMTSVLQEKFHFENELPFVFIDSWAKHPMNVEDATQQHYFDKETSKLWEIAMNNQPFQFLTLEDILEENQKMKERIEYLEDIIAKDISNLNKTLDHVTERLDDNTFNIVTNGINTRSNKNSIENIEGNLMLVEEDLSKEVTERKDYDNLLNTEIDSIKKDISAIKTNMGNLPGKWSSGSYCILANGACPTGFTRLSGHLWALDMYSANSPYIEPVKFGDSYLMHELTDHSNIGITACCK